MLAQANKRFPDDTDLLYEQAMMAEKLDRLDEMERLLRRVIALKPDHHHAYNALGYSLADRKLRLPEARDADPEGARADARASRSSPTAWAGSSTAWATARRRCACCAAPTRRGPTRRSPPTSARCCGASASATRRGASGARRARATRSNDVLRETLARLRVDL